MKLWAVILAVAVGTYLIRASLLLLRSRRTPPAAVVARAALVAPAALAALLVSAGAHAPGLPVVLGCAAGFAVTLRTRNVVHALLVGLPAVWVAQALGLG
ncbi:AzlD domain-containing protein [Nocardioides sp. YIM 152588]|uniref:AzlD domain-containing protein n=1 Tax=Nocardioides sp. YIM 152588 TaxID=3158259 RepID=UPI0032E40EBB